MNDDAAEVNRWNWSTGVLSLGQSQMNDDAAEVTHWNWSTGVLSLGQSQMNMMQQRSLIGTGPLESVSGSMSNE